MENVKVPYQGLEGLASLMARLRSPEGCPWDRKQTYSSLRRYIVEEAFELVEAIEADRFDLVAIGRPLIANPDYLAKVKQGDALVPYADTMLAELV